MKKNISWLIILLLVLSAVCCQCPKSDVERSVDRKWWKEAVVYQIYPRSFKDTDGDGVGDLKGIIEKLDYIKSLGIDVIWLNPIYSSPNDDNGYDISDYRNIMAEFGTMEDFDSLLAGMHDRGIKLVMDLVVNHSSDEHEWFRQSRSSRDNPYRDYYHWWSAEKGKPNYRWSFFDENSDAWRYDSTTNAYYLHYFSRKQPDLNWENPQVRQEVYAIMKFWLDKGIDGFRMDAFQFIAKDTTFPAFPEGFEKQVIKYYGMGPHIHDYLKEMHDSVLSKYDVLTVSEGAGSTFEDAHNLVDADRKELSMAYHFEGMDIWNNPENKDLLEFKKVYTRWDSAFADKGWLSIFLANHDVPRMVSKFGNDSPEFRAVSSKMLTTFILTMRGTSYYYNGDEIGMTNIGFDSIGDYRDVAALNEYQRLQRQGGNLDSLVERLKFISRDNCRTPFQWDTTANAGFTTGTPWIQVNPNYKTVNVAVEEGDPNSCLSYFRKMVKLRKESPVLVYGRYEIIDPENKQVYAYSRTLNDEKLLVVLNFSQDTVDFQLPEGMKAEEEISCNLETGGEFINGQITLKPYQASVYRLD
ncbi:glycoside hydrolase family 13 protein [Mangrovibacterium lignilyticum]|uniref:glycoside hydrolase family 13 protein n=1 Tax=Mangrovibacterium lignilyticum TaxID=2668052 RepID=UPI0013D51F4B|nr:alpha-glucosidase [Mangrovibacterium lignilyticum]